MQKVYDYSYCYYLLKIGHKFKLSRQHIEVSDNDASRDSASSNSTLNHSSGGSANSPSFKNKNGGGTTTTDSSTKFVRELSHTLSIDSNSTNELNECGNSGGSSSGAVDIQALAFSPSLNTHDVLAKNGIKFKTLFDKTRINNK